MKMHLKTQLIQTCDTLAELQLLFVKSIYTYLNANVLFLGLSVIGQRYILSTVFVPLKICLRKIYNK